MFYDERTVSGFTGKSQDAPACGWGGMEQSPILPELLSKAWHKFVPSSLSSIGLEEPMLACSSARLCS